MTRALARTGRRGGHGYGAPMEMRQATPEEQPALAGTLARAFHDDPIFLHMRGGQMLSEQVGRRFFDPFLTIQMRHGHVYTTAGHEGVAVWAPPGEWEIPFSDVVRFAPAFIRVFGWRLPASLKLLRRLEDRHPSEPHWYLEFIGTDPAHQGTGAGSALMRPMMERCDAEGVGAYLESSKESNLAFYGRFGFEVTGVVRHPDGPEQWLMWRDPR